MRRIKTPLQDFALKMQGGLMCKGAYLRDTMVLSYHPYILCHFANYAHHKFLTCMHISLFTPTE